jgi:hypothetical protein
MLKAIRTRGYIRFDKNISHPPPSFQPYIEVQLRTRAAQIVSEREPNKSALIPPTSPIFSPTFIVIVQGFFELSFKRN